MKLERIKRDLKLLDVAQALDTSSQAIGYIEANKDSLTLNYLKYLRKIGVDLNELFED